MSSEDFEFEAIDAEIRDCPISNDGHEVIQSINESISADNR